jgi:hypothetical protein
MPGGANPFPLTPAEWHVLKASAVRGRTDRPLHTDPLVPIGPFSADEWLPAARPVRVSQPAVRHHGRVALADKTASANTCAVSLARTWALNLKPPAAAPLLLRGSAREPLLSLPQHLRSPS